MIEDDFTYVLRKALTGCGMTPEGAAEAANVSVGDVTGFLDGTFSAITARKLAAVLGLNAEAFDEREHFRRLDALDHATELGRQASDVIV